MESCRLCLTMFKVFQVITYLSVMWLLGIILLKSASDILRGLNLFLPRSKADVPQESPTSNLMMK